jgi:alkaline phosphatase
MIRFAHAVRGIAVFGSLFTLAFISPSNAAGQETKKSEVAASREQKTAGDHIRELQNSAVNENRASWGHWGADPGDYTEWGTHSSRLVPVYTFGTKGAGEGIDLESYTGSNSVYRDADALQKLYGRLPEQTLNPEAEYLDQTDLARLQQAALKAGKKHIFLVIFDGMDWQTTRNAAIVKTGEVLYESGRGRGLHFQDYDAAGTSQFGFMVTVPQVEGGQPDVNSQTIGIGKAPSRGGYSARLGGATPWSQPLDRLYLLGKSPALVHPYPDSAATATSMTTGAKTYNGSINVSTESEQLTTIAHVAQRRGYRVGAVSSVPISHATPACAYAHNVTRNDYQDISRDLLGLPSVAHPEQPLPGLDVIIGGGYGTRLDADRRQGKNFLPGNKYLADEDLKRVNFENGGRYQVALRTAGRGGSELLAAAARSAAKHHRPLLGFFGVGKYSGHLPYQTADGDYHPALGRRQTAEEYTRADLEENPTLADMTAAALTVLGEGDRPLWLMVEPGDVDWANHDDNLDNSIGAVFSGEAAVRAITDWVENNSNWKESVMIVTADHGHYFFLTDPKALLPAR